ncbi:hypothetical protein L228DRAFT_270124 [Xylona heveae TC161]|uniref:RRM domain-containing protein n=1 Tax=Xylona heveae (strain CBS 132557 / TC161) TaxID=1328760 RepID=A0A165FDB7_XYLHT|nr:hypothetical protein L228DRAFT_270124 [Xylona heveae TC161]KZF20851.1 hypothetical protein L228DRAFT_270124 [Xylona heveae TC161]
MFSTQLGRFAPRALRYPFPQIVVCSDPAVDRKIHASRLRDDFPEQCKAVNFGSHLCDYFDEYDLYLQGTDYLLSVLGEIASYNFVRAGHVCQFAAVWAVDNMDRFLAIGPSTEKVFTDAEISLHGEEFCVDALAQLKFLKAYKELPPPVLIHHLGPWVSQELGANAPAIYPYDTPMVSYAQYPQIQTPLPHSPALAMSSTTSPVSVVAMPPSLPNNWVQPFGYMPRNTSAPELSANLFPLDQIRTPLRPHTTPGMLETYRGLPLVNFGIHQGNRRISENAPITQNHVFVKTTSPPRGPDPLPVVFHQQIPVDSSDYRATSKQVQARKFSREYYGQRLHQRESTNDPNRPAAHGGRMSSYQSGIGRRISGDNKMVTPTVSPPTTVYVGNIPDGIDQNYLTWFFRDFGPVLEVFIPRRYQYSRFKFREGAIRAVNHNSGVFLHGYRLKIEMGRPPGAYIPKKQHADSAIKAGTPEKLVSHTESPVKVIYSPQDVRSSLPDADELALPSDDSKSTEQTQTDQPDQEALAAPTNQDLEELVKNFAECRLEISSTTSELDPPSPSPFQTSVQASASETIPHEAIEGSICVEVDNVLAVQDSEVLTSGDQVEESVEKTADDVESHAPFEDNNTTPASQGIEDQSSSPLQSDSEGLVLNVSTMSVESTPEPSVANGGLEPAADAAVDGMHTFSHSESRDQDSSSRYRNMHSQEPFHFTLSEASPPLSESKPSAETTDLIDSKPIAAAKKSIKTPPPKREKAKKTKRRNKAWFGPSPEDVVSTESTDSKKDVFSEGSDEAGSSQYNESEANEPAKSTSTDLGNSSAEDECSQEDRADPQVLPGSSVHSVSESDGLALSEKSALRNEDAAEKELVKEAEHSPTYTLQTVSPKIAAGGLVQLELTEDNAGQNKSLMQIDINVAKSNTQFRQNSFTTTKDSPATQKSVPKRKKNKGKRRNFSRRDLKNDESNEFSPKTNTPIASGPKTNTSITSGQENNTPIPSSPENNTPIAQGPEDNTPIPSSPEDNTQIKLNTEATTTECISCVPLPYAGNFDEWAKPRERVPSVASDKHETESTDVASSASTTSWSQVAARSNPSSDSIQLRTKESPSVERDPWAVDSSASDKSQSLAPEHSEQKLDEPDFAAPPKTIMTIQFGSLSAVIVRSVAGSINSDDSSRQRALSQGSVSSNTTAKSASSSVRISDKDDFPDLVKSASNKSVDTPPPKAPVLTPAVRAKSSIDGKKTRPLEEKKPLNAAKENKLPNQPSSDTTTNDKKKNFPKRRGGHHRQFRERTNNAQH